MVYPEISQIYVIVGFIFKFYYIIHQNLPFPVKFCFAAQVRGIENSRKDHSIHSKKISGRQLFHLYFCASQK
jgi:hypothetical protein